MTENYKDDQAGDIYETQHHNNRRSTKSRINQTIHLKNGKSKIIRHQTNSDIDRKTKQFNLLERIIVNKSKWHKAHSEYRKKAV